MQALPWETQALRTDRREEFTGEGGTAPLRARCVVCGGGTRPWHRVNDCDIVDCTVCGHRFVPGAHDARHVAQNFGDDYFAGGGAGYPDYVADGPLLRERGRRYAALLALHTPPGRVLDVGAAAGFILQGLVEAGWSGRGVEPNAAMAGYGRDTLGLAIDCADLECYQPGETFDLVCMLQSMMHFYDVRRACEAALALTRPGGFWLIEAFDPESSTARLLGRRWHDYNPPSVLRWLAPRVLRLLLIQYGLEEVDRGRAPKVISAAHAKSALIHKLGNGVAGRASRLLLAAVPDRLAIPYPGDDIYWALYRRTR